MSTCYIIHGRLGLFGIRKDRLSYLPAADNFGMLAQHPSPVAKHFLASTSNSMTVGS